MKNIRSKETLEHFFGKVDQTNPLEFKEKNNFIYNYAQEMLDSENKYNKGLFYEVLGKIKKPSKHTLEIKSKLKDKSSINQDTDNGPRTKSREALKDKGGKAIFDYYNQPSNKHMLNMSNGSFDNKSANTSIIESYRTKNNISNYNKCKSNNMTKVSFFEESPSPRKHNEEEKCRTRYRNKLFKGKTPMKNYFEKSHSSISSIDYFSSIKKQDNNKICRSKSTITFDLNDFNKKINDISQKNSLCNITQHKNSMSCENLHNRQLNISGVL